VYFYFCLASVHGTNNGNDTNTFTDFQCTSDSECNTYGDETIVIAKCNETTGTCNCILPSCHDYNNSTNQCELKSCHKIVLSSDKTRIDCVNHGSKSKKNALLLNIISFTGATNFYLGNYGLAAGQLLLFMILLITAVVRLGSCCFLCCVICQKQSCDNCGLNNKNARRGIGTIYTFGEVSLVLLSIAELIWMIHDFIKIAINGKLDGDGCFLDDDTINLIQGIAINTLEVGS